MTTVTISMAGPTRPILMPGRTLHPTNTKIRLLVGLMLAGLCVLLYVNEPLSLIAPAPRPGVATAAPLAATSDATALDSLAVTDHIALLQRCLDNYHGKYADYTCTFTKQERIGGVLGKEQEIRVRFRGSPFSAAMTWVKNPPMGDRVLYVAGRNNDEMQVRPASLLLQILIPNGVSRKPDGAEAMKVTLRAVNLFGFECAMKSLLEVYRAAKSNGDLQEEFGGYCTLDGQDTLVLVRYLTARRKDYPAHKTVTYINVKRMVPVMIEGYDWGAGDFLCRYTYSDVKFNVGLTEADFTPESIGLKSN